jgi:hypothetical protein
MGNKNPEQLSPEGMRQFTGSEHWYRHAINRKVVFHGRGQACCR